MANPPSDLPFISTADEHNPARELAKLHTYKRIAIGLKHLHERWNPHEAQARIGGTLLNGQAREVFAQCGRNFGKTELVAYLLWRYAWTFPKSENYYFAPFMKQAREILWEPRRIQDFGPKTWIKDINETEMRVTFFNDSFIKLDGSNNVDAYRGVKPKGLTIYDEFKDFLPAFHDAYDPNRAAFGSPLLILGTPPELEGQFTKVAEEFKTGKGKAFFQFPSSSNPHIDHKWLADKKAELYAKGEGDKWEREYEARFVKGGSKRIFPMLKEDMIRRHSAIMAEIEKDKRRLEWFWWADPAGASCFANLFVAINPYTKTVYCLDEIYETRQQEMTVNKIIPAGETIVKELAPKVEWRRGYDEAETWFANEALEHYSLYFEPTQKASNDKTTGLSLIKDVMLQGKLVISMRCRKLYWEMDNYQTDDNGKIVKKHDHLIDCLRYILAASHYSLNEAVEMKPEHDPMWRGAKPEDDFPTLKDGGLDEWEASLW